jgi:hypothetical protein
MSERDELFPAKLPDVLSETPTHIESSERALVDIQIATAKRYPRNLAKVKNDLISYATLDQETASGCFYRLPRAGKNILGPSVRIAEIAVSCYGNLKVGSRVIDVDTRSQQPHVTVQSVCIDLENNVAVSIEKRRRIVGKKGRQIDEDDINLAVNSCSAIAFRDSVFKVIPQALVKPAWQAALKVAVGDVNSLVDRRTKAIDKFAQAGVTPDRVLAVLEIDSVEQITLDHLATLIGLWNTIQDGALIEDIFPAVEKKKPVESKPVAEVAKAPVRKFAANPSKKVESASEDQDQIPLGESGEEVPQ